ETNAANIQLTPSMISDISFKNVAFRYGTRENIFENLTLNIKSGSYTAIVGESGSGKSSLMALLQKIYPIQQGQIFIGKYPLNYLNTNSIRKLIAIVPQKVDLFNGTVAENIAIGDDEMDMRRMVDICMQLGILQFIESLPEGFQTPLGENGANLSGGQKQRIAIARALYREPEIIILDEATSSLDSNAEKYVQQSVKLLMQQHKTIIVIAHRLATIRNAEQIIVLAKGAVIESGTHEKLLSMNGQYAQLWNQQY
ncbi:MAG: ATP-binding cassette domain-containing protein, partial [Bacteroidia bacterium]